MLMTKSAPSWRPSRCSADSAAAGGAISIAPKTPSAARNAFPIARSLFPCRAWLAPRPKGSASHPAQISRQIVAARRDAGLQPRQQIVERLLAQLAVDRAMAGPGHGALDQALAAAGRLDLA